ncbi:MAG: hypothetical protein R3D03_04540 [Geminicoccaceae bacterium]
MPLGEIEAGIEAAGAGRMFTIIPRYLSEQELADTIAGSDIIVFPIARSMPAARTCATQFARPIVATDIGAFGEGAGARPCVADPGGEHPGPAPRANADRG